MNATLLKLRLFYLATSLGNGLLVPYLSLLLIHDGLTSSQIGVVLAIGTAVSILVQPAWGLLVDRTGRTRLTLALSALVPGLLAGLYNAHIWFLIVLVNLVSNAFSATQAPISDTYAVNAARRFRTSYGTIRLFGSLGFALGGYAGGLFLSHFSITVLWTPFAILSCIGALAAIAFPRPHTPDEAADATREARGSVEVHVGPTVTGGLWSLLRQRRFVVFLIGGLFVNQTLTGFNTYFTLTFHAIGGTMALTGVAFLLASGTNVPAMLVAATVIARVGRERTMLLACVAYGVRWGVQAFLPIPWLAIAIQVLHGISFGFLYVASVDFVSSSAPREWQATAQSVFGMVCGGLAGIVGNVWNGLLLHSYGASVMYGSCLVSALLGGLCFLWVWRDVETNRKGQLGRKTAPDIL